MANANGFILWQAIQDGHLRDVQLAALLHDAAEAFCGDVVKPLKIMLADYAVLERRISDAIYQRFNLQITPEIATIVEEIDNAMLIAERKALFSEDGVIWSGEKDVRKLNVPFMCLNPSDAGVEYFKRLFATWSG